MQATEKQVTMAAQLYDMRDKALQARLAEWEKLKDPVALHVNLLLGFPCQLDRETFLHLAGHELPSVKGERMTTAQPMMDSEPEQPAVGIPLDRQVRALGSERAAFEAWWCKAYHPHALQEKESNCYLDLSVGMAWDAWQAARPKRSDVGRLVNLAAKLIATDTLRKLWHLEEESGRTLGRRALSDALADADEKLKLAAIELARVARAL